MAEHKLRRATPLGDMLLSASDEALTGAWFVNQKYAPDPKGFPYTEQSSPVLRATTKWLNAYFESSANDDTKINGIVAEHNNRNNDYAVTDDDLYRATLTSLLPKLAPLGTEFQQQVWHALTLIPVGDTPTYGQLACSLGKPSAVRAVAAAIGRNPISILIPCHRVIGANGSLTGYAGGLDRKRWLLTHEQRCAQQCLPV